MALLEQKKRKNKNRSSSSVQVIDTSLWSDEAKADYARSWRDEELKKTDWICSIPDHGSYSSYMVYRTSLRDWPSTDDFPETKPTL